VTWDISKIDEWKSDEFPRGAVIPDSGNSRDYVTGGGVVDTDAGIRETSATTAPTYLNVQVRLEIKL